MIYDKAGTGVRESREPGLRNRSSVAARRPIVSATAIGLLLLLPGSGRGRDMTTLFPRAGSFVDVPAPNKFLPMLHAFRANTQDLVPTPTYVDSEAEAKELLIAMRAIPTPWGVGGTCNYSGISISDVSGWTFYVATFSKSMHLNFSYDCADSKHTSSGTTYAAATMSSPMGCADIADEMRSLVVDGKFHTPYDPMACVHRLAIDRPPCCDSTSGYGTGPMYGGKPINFGTGREVMIETDYAAPKDSRLTFQRYYEVHTSTPYLPSAIGRDWNHSFNRALFDGGNPLNGVYSIGICEPNGHWTWFTQAGPAYVSMYHPADTLTKVDLGGGAYQWRRNRPNNDVETYDSSGRNTRIDTSGGRYLILDYDSSNRLARVANEMGRALQFTYGANGRLSQLGLPDGATVTYDYSMDSIPRLTAIHYPGTAARTYSYDTAGRLTGSTDENGSAYFTATYSSYGKANATTLAGGLNRYAYTPAYASGGPLVYGNEGAAGSFALTTPLGTTIGFTTVNVNGTIRPASVSLPCPECGVTDAALTYDANGNVTSRTDFNNKKACYAYDLSRNLETARAEGILSTETCGAVLATLPSRTDVRKVSTQWHATWRLPVTIAEPNRITTFAYHGDINGPPPGHVVRCAPLRISVVCSKTVQETIDGTGQQGFAATATGTPRVWRYTYDSFGQVLTATDPNNQTTTTVYYAANDPDPGRRGNVRTVTNPLGHVTSFTAYDAHGRPTSITDPNGTVTTLTYHPRGWLTARTVGGEQTTYDYDGVGQLTKVTLPDASYVQYAYDAAHRLIQVQDGLGNKIVYTLDAMGNRIREEAYDPSGQVARVRQRVFDSLSRLHQTVGAR